MRFVRTLLAGAGALLLAAAAIAQDVYPSRPVTVVVPAAAGSLTDASARILTARLAAKLRQPFIIENRTGANGAVAMEHLIRQKPDGYTLTLAPSSTHAGNPSLFKKLRYDPIADFTPIARFAQTALVVSVHSELPVHNMKELIAYAKQRPGKVSYAWANSGSRVGADMIAAQAKLDLIGAAYKVSGQALTDLIAGHVDMYVIDFQTAQGSVKSGKIRGLAVTTAQPSPVFPGLPTVAETLPGFEIVAWNALYGPAGLPRPIVDKLAQAVGEILAEPETQTSMLNNGLTPMPTKSPQELGAYTASQIELWRKLVKRAGIEPE